MRFVKNRIFFVLKKGVSYATTNGRKYKENIAKNGKNKQKQGGMVKNTMEMNVIDCKNIEIV